MSTTYILLVEDEPAIREMLCLVLGQAGFEVIEAEDAAQALRCIGERLPDLILLDWMLPDQSGIELARRLRKGELTAEVPIIMLTARGEEEDKVKALGTGADDYVTKPFSPRELVARIRAVLRRFAPLAGECIEAEGLRLDPRSHRVIAGGEPLALGPTEFRLLHFFMTHPERVYNRSQLLDRVWGSNVYVEERTVDVHILRLRKALSASGHDRLIQTVRGTGYRFSTQE
jgi:two-component system, OmpR family, phosphate regulon response regulator PhoB